MAVTLWDSMGEIIWGSTGVAGRTDALAARPAFSQRRLAGHVLCARSIALWRGPGENRQRFQTAMALAMARPSRFRRGSIAQHFGPGTRAATRADRSRAAPEIADAGRLRCAHIARRKGARANLRLRSVCEVKMPPFPRR